MAGSGWKLKVPVCNASLIEWYSKESQRIDSNIPDGCLNFREMRLINEELFEFLFKINKLEVLKKLAVKCSSFSPFKSLLAKKRTHSWVFIRKKKLKINDKKRLILLLISNCQAELSIRQRGLPHFSSQWLHAAKLKNQIKE